MQTELLKTNYKLSQFLFNKEKKSLSLNDLSLKSDKLVKS